MGEASRQMHSMRADLVDVDVVSRRLPDVRISDDRNLFCMFIDAFMHAFSSSFALPSQRHGCTFLRRVLFWTVAAT